VPLINFTLVRKKWKKWQKRNNHFKYQKTSGISSWGFFILSIIETNIKHYFMREIEKKFLIKNLPNLESVLEVKYERYFLEISDNKEIRIQKKWNTYEKETKTKLNHLEYEKIKQEITGNDFNGLKKDSIWKIHRSSYKISENPEVSIKIYSWRFLWLSRLEVEFWSESEAKNFQPESWYWKEITGTSLAKDSELVKLSRKDFQNHLSKNLT